MRAGLIATITALTLGGCGLTQQIDSSACQGYGLTPGTGAFANCMIRRDEFRRSAMLATGIALMASQPSYAPPQPAEPPTRMICNRNALTSGSTCFAQ